MPKKIIYHIKDNKFQNQHNLNKQCVVHKESLSIFTFTLTAQYSSPEDLSVGRVCTPLPSRPLLQLPLLLLYWWRNGELRLPVVNVTKVKVSERRLHQTFVKEQRIYSVNNIVSNSNSSKQI